MKFFSWYTGGSILLHLLLILALVDLDFSAKKSAAYDVYEVDIVAEAPSSVRKSSSAKSANTRYVNSKKNSPKSLSGINKEKAIRDSAPELTPSKIEPEKNTEDPYPDSSPAPSNTTAQQTPSSTSGQQGRAGDEYAYLITLWKSQVRGVVNRVWKAPPEISLVDMSLKTTYLLRISRIGELLDKRLLVSSGNAPFDRSVLLALSNVKRLPQPPFVLIAGHDSVDVTMSFTPPKGAQ